MWKVLLAVCAVASMAAATSSGVNGFSNCHVLSASLGCDPARYTNGDHLRCQDKATVQMDWTDKAKRNGSYEVYITKTGEDTPVTSYLPGETLDVHVRYKTFDSALTYRGIMMHFQQSSNANAAGAFASPGQALYDDAKVGSWAVVPAQPRLFHSTLNAECGPAVLLHATAGYKLSHELFRFNTPAAGTGAIALRVLIKWGDANAGAFYWPNLAGDVVLTEGAPYTAPSTPLRWIRGDLGQSCDAVCGANSLTCNTAALADGALNNEESLLNAIHRTGVVHCDLPILSHCGALGPTSSDTDFCYFHDPVMCGVNSDLSSAAATCAASSMNAADGMRLCPCGTCTATPNPCVGKCGVISDGCRSVNCPPCGCGVTPFCGENEVCENGECSCPTGLAQPDGSCQLILPEAPAEQEVSSSSRNVASAFSLLAGLAVVLSTANRRSVFAVLAVIALIAVVQPSFAHNWITSPSRSRFASTVAPFLEQNDPNPHVMVGPGNTFLMEYVQGHTGASYFVVHKWEDRGKVKDLTNAILDDYLNTCTTGNATVLAKTVTGRRYHRRRGVPDATHFQHQNDVADADGNLVFHNDVFENTPITSGAGYWPKPTNFPVPGTPFRANNGNTTAMFQLNYVSSKLDKDRRCKGNTKYPWIIEVAKTEHCTEQPSRPDVLQFNTNGWSTYGHYMVSWRWRGYYDATDIDYVNQNVPEADKYGQAFVTPPYRRIDHAYFYDDRPRRTTLANYDVRESTTYGTCQQVVTDVEFCMRDLCGTSTSCTGIQITPLRIPGTADATWRTLLSTADGYTKLIPWGNSTYECNPALWPAGLEDMQVCYAIRSATPSSTQGEYVTTEDPRDPIFYSTIYWKSTGKNFTLLPGSPFGQGNPTPVKWKFGDRCISCDELQRSDVDLAVPNWVTYKAPNCRNCDIEPSTMARVDYSLKWAKVNDQSYCVPNGTATPSFCYIHLQPQGSNNPSRRNLMNARVCQKLALDHPECTNYAYWNNDADSRDGYCGCFRNHPTCGACNRVRPATTVTGSGTTITTIPQTTSISTYELVPSAADPTCATGVRGLTNTTYCCSATCIDTTGQPTCTNSNTVYLGKGGWCTGMSLVTRRCSQYGPPCIV